MAEMILRATGSKLKIISEIHVTSTQAQYDTCLFEFDEAWDGYGLRTAVFYSHPKNIKAMVLDTDNRCFIPWDAFSNSRYLYIGIYGANGDSYLPTQFVEVMYQTGANIDDHLYPPTPGIYEQIASKLSLIRLNLVSKATKAELVDLATELDSKADAIGLDRLAGTVSELFIKKADKVELADVQAQVNGLVSGSPKGAYATLADLQAAKPTGDTGIYVVSADGQWYYWDGNAWTAGAAYQSASVKAGDVSTLSGKNVQSQLDDLDPLKAKVYESLSLDDIFRVNNTIKNPEMLDRNGDGLADDWIAGAGATPYSNANGIQTFTLVGSLSSNPAQNILYDAYGAQTGRAYINIRAKSSTPKSTMYIRRASTYDTVTFPIKDTYATYSAFVDFTGSGSFTIGTNIPVTYDIDHVYVVKMSVFITPPDLKTLDALLEEYLRIVTKTAGYAVKTAKESIGLTSDSPLLVRINNNLPEVIKDFPVDYYRFDTNKKTLIVANSMSGWSGSTALLSVDNDITHEGEPTLRMASNGSSIVVTYALTSPTSIMDYDYLELIIRVNDQTIAKPTAMSNVRFIDGDGNYKEVNIGRYFERPDYADLKAGWRRVRVSLRAADHAPEFVISGTPNYTDIRAVRIAIAGSAASIFDYRLAKLSVVKVDKGRIFIDFDDGNLSDYTVAKPIMDALGLRGTSYVVSSFIGQQNMMTVAHLREMADAGWTIGSHFYSHGYIHDGLSGQALIDEIVKSKEWMRRNGLTRGSYFCATPGGGFNASARQELVKHFVSVRMGFGPNVHTSLPPHDNYNVSYRSHNADPNWTLQDHKDVVDQIISRKSIYHMTFHRLAAPATTYSFDPAMFADLMAYIAQARDAGILDVITPEDLFFGGSGPVGSYGGIDSLMSYSGDKLRILHLTR